MSKREPLLRIDLPFEDTVRALLQTPPVPHDTMGSRKAAPPKPKKKAKRRRYAKPAATGTYAYESAPVVTKKRKATKKR